MTLIALHMLQNHAPSNLNRDDNGDPKDALFGGTRRARISSQALKRSIRWHEDFRNAFPEQVLAFRTQLLPEEVRKRLSNTNLDAAAQQAIVEAVVKFGKADSGDAGESGEKGGKKKPTDTKLKNKQLMFLAAHEIDQLTEELVEKYTRDPKAFASTKWDNFRQGNDEKYIPHSVDIAMFGRMTTSSPFKDVEAAVQVAHALSTHTVEQEFDFYTAVDDISGEAGAGFLGETSFNSATYYKYINIHWEGLLANLQNDHELAAQAVRTLIHTATVANPSGKQNSFAAHNLPDLVLVEVSPNNSPLSYANAFLKPVRAQSGRSLIEESALALRDYSSKLREVYDLESQLAYFTTLDGLDWPNAIRHTSRKALLEWLPLPTGA
jgi:CRISPR system Cascade subunit CasC